jgi:hypothetical protein
MVFIGDKGKRYLFCGGEELCMIFFHSGGFKKQGLLKLRG